MDYFVMDYLKLLQYFILVLLALFGGVFITLAVIYLADSRRAKPGSYDNFPNLPSELASRTNKIRHLVGRIRTGQSSALIGFFSEERTSILGYLRNENPKQRQMLYGDKADQLIFSYIDIAFLSKECSPFEFWEMALEPLRREMVADSELAQAYQEAKDNQFKRLKLENLIGLVSEQGWRLVLLLDRFENLLQYPHFQENFAFFTALRQLAASRTPSPLVLVIASNQSLEAFHQQIQHLSPDTSPVLNFIESIAILGLSESEVDDLLERGQPLLSPNVRQFVKKMAGGHPHLLKLMVSHCWKNHSTSELGTFDETALENFFTPAISKVAERVITSWSSLACRAFLAVAQQQAINEHDQQGLQDLESQGVVENINNQWQVRAHIFLNFLESIQVLCNTKTAEN
jgi:hypothetical protein